MTESVAREVARERKPPVGEGIAADRYVNAWSEPEALNGQRVRAFVLILRTRGCYWADLKGCSMCGYAKDTLGRSATPAELTLQLEQALRRYRGEPYIKIYTSGSFLDDREVDPESRRKIISAFSGRAQQFLFETLPEFVEPSRVEPLRDAFAGQLEIAVGLESTQPEVLGRFISKVSTPDAYLEAATRIREMKVRAKAYLLLKPPYLTEGESIDDVITSITHAAPRFDSISVNPVHIQNGTVVERLYRARQYRPPWLWSLAEVLSEGSRRAGSTRLVSFPTAGGLPRGPHNCGRCDSGVLSAIQEASLDQAFAPLASLDCSCRKTWETHRELEPLGVEA